MVKLAISAGRPGFAFVTIPSSRALISGLHIPSGTVHRGLASCHVGCLLFPEGIVKLRGRKEEERQNSATSHAR